MTDPLVEIGIEADARQIAEATGGRQSAATDGRFVGRTTAIVFVGNVVARGLGFLFPLVVAHATGRIDFALAYFLINTGFTVGELVLSGYPTALTRSLAGMPDATRGSALTSAIIGGLPLLVFSMVVGEVLAAAAGAPPFLVSTVVLGLTVDAYYFGVLRGLRRFGWLVAYRIIANVAQLVLLLAAVALGIASVPIVVAIYAGVYLISVIVVETSAGPGRTLLRGDVRPSRARIADMTGFAGLALASGTAYAAILGLDVFFVRLFAPDGLAEYGAARALAMPMSLVSFAVGTVLMPQVAGASEAARRGLLVRALALTVVAAMAGVVAYVIAAPLAVELVLPPSFDGAAPLVASIAAAVGLLGVYSILSQWWMGIGRPAIPAMSLASGALVATAAHLVVTARLGASGAPIAVAIGAATALALLGVATVRRAGGAPT